jgi:hypothetical protein
MIQARTRRSEVVTISEAFDHWWAQPRLTTKMIREGNVDPLSSRDNAERAFQAGVRWARKYKPWNGPQ